MQAYDCVVITGPTPDRESSLSACDDDDDDDEWWMMDDDDDDDDDKRTALQEHIIKTVWHVLSLSEGQRNEIRLQHDTKRSNSRECVRERKGNVSRGLLSDETNHGTVTEENNKIRASLITSKQTNKKPTSTATSSLASDVCNAVHVKQCSKVD